MNYQEMHKNFEIAFIFEVAKKYIKGKTRFRNWLLKKWINEYEINKRRVLRPQKYNNEFQIKLIGRIRGYGCNHSRLARDKVHLLFLKAKCVPASF